MAKLMVVGGGKMGAALVGGLLAAAWATPDELVVVEIDPERRAQLGVAHPGLVVTDTMGEADAALLAVKPAQVPATCTALGRLGVARVLSIAAGVRIATMEQALPEGTAVVRAMPNTPSLVGQGAAAVAPGSNAGEDDLAWAEEVLGAVGTVERVTEDQLDAVTGLSGSGPAYVFLLAEAMIDAGVLNGLPRPVAAALVTQTLRGAAELLAGGQSPADLRAAVTSPGGTTAAGLRALEASGARAGIVDGVVAATERSRELG